MVCDIWLARDFLRTAGRPIDIPPCQHDTTDCPPIREGAPEMFKTETCVSVRCDDCGDGLEYDGHIPHFTTQDEAMDAAREYEWTFTRDGAAYCDPSELPACTCADDSACGDDCPTGCPCVLHDEVKAPAQDSLLPAQS